MNELYILIKKIKTFSIKIFRVILRMGCVTSKASIAPSFISINNDINSEQLAMKQTTSSSKDTGDHVLIDSDLVDYAIDGEDNINRSVRDLKDFVPFRTFLSQNKEPRIFEYKFIKQLGRGTRADVYLVRNTENNIDFAAKVYDKAFLYRNNLSDNEPPIEKVIREITIMSLLKHPYTLPLIEVLDDDYTNSVIIIQKFADRGSLLPQKLITDPFPEERARVIFFQLCVAVRYIHSKNIIHRDIKPENIMCMSDGSILLSDYSVSVMLQDPDQLLEDTEGTPAFYSPEQCTGKPYRGKPADVWACGITLYILLFGRLPFFKASDDKHFLSQFFKFAHQIQNEELKFPDEIVVSDLSKDLLLRCLDKDPNKRYNIENVLKHKWFEGFEPPYFEESEEDEFFENNDELTE